MTSRRDEIRNRVLAGIVGGASQGAPRPAEAPTRVRAYIAQVGDQLTEGLAHKVERLEAEREAGLVVLRLDPKVIRATEFSNRLEASLAEGDPEFEKLKASLREHGQVSPIRVRPAPAGSGAEYEIVYGHRRHAAALALDAETEGGFRVLALVDAAAVDPKRLAAAMHDENDARHDISAYEYGRMYRSWLDAGLFATQGELAAFVGKSDAAITQSLRVYALPQPVLHAFGDRRAISLRWAQELAKALRQNEAAVLAAAARVSALDPRPSPDQVLRALTARPAAEGRRSASREQVVKILGKVAFRIAHRDGRISLKLGTGIDRATQKELTEEIKELAEGLLSKRLKSE
jgi:ParB family chromosome partitioning protein